LGEKGPGKPCASASPNHRHEGSGEQPRVKWQGGDSTVELGDEFERMTVQTIGRKMRTFFLLNTFYSIYLRFARWCCGVT
jgi:hypothetical protein